MTLISATRLRNRSIRFLPGFFYYALMSTLQARRAPGNLGMRSLSDANRTFWTATVWKDEAAMRAFMMDAPHRKAMPKLIRWIQESPALPDWQEAHRRMAAEGRPSKMSGKSGIFSSVWTENDSTRTGRLHYNIHALKLRQLKSYLITSRNFAGNFRKAFKSLNNAWPNVRVDYGPLNLMQGWIEYREKTFEPDVLRLMRQFDAVCPIIDRLLEERIAPVRRRR